MSEVETNKPEIGPENQQQRWIKYGSNVVLSVIVVILLAAALIYIAQWKGWRTDTTVGRTNSLKPQTVNIIKDTKDKTKLVALYAEKDANGKPNIYRQPVVDLLEEYGRKGKNIDVETIDPVNSPTKVDSLIAEVTDKYGGEVKKYSAVIDAFKQTSEQIRNIAAGQIEKVQTLPVDKVDEQKHENEGLALKAVQEFPTYLTKAQEAIDRKLKLKPPDYKSATDSVEAATASVGDTAGKVVEIFNKAKGDATLPAVIQKYMVESTPAYTQIKKLSDDLLKKVKELGELKLDDLRQSLKARDAILVMGQKDMRVVPFEQVWKVDSRELRQMPPGGGEIKPRFAGEQMISTSLLALSQEKKPKVAFVRFGGPPLTPAGFPPFQRGGPMSEVADRLRQYNFEVLEKDLSGMWAIQSQMGGQPPQPEATDEQLKDAVWVVLMFPLSQQGPMQPPADFKKVTEHLDHGGSALLLFSPQTDNFSSTLKNWGIEVNTSAVAAHEPIKPSEGKEGTDILEQAARYPFVFNIDNYGDHMLTKPLRSLAGFFVPMEVVKTTSAADVTVTPILPVPNEPKSWGETNLDGLNDGKAVYETGDVEGPLFGGAVAEKKNGGRLVVIACPTFAFDDWVSRLDPNMWRQGLRVARYPANAELFANSVFWLAKMEPMIAISPAAMEVSRISSMSNTSLNMWRIGVLLIGLPGLVLVAGALVYIARQD